MDFLPSDTRSMLDDDIRDVGWVSARHKDVIVIGGGDTGTDCVGTSLRHGCNSVVQLEILPRPPPTAGCRQPLAGVAADLQASTTGRKRPWRRSARPARRICITTKRFVGDEHGHVQGSAHGAGRVGRRTSAAV